MLRNISILFILFFTFSIFGSVYHFEDLKDHLNLSDKTLKILKKYKIITTTDFLEKNNNSSKRVKNTKLLKLPLENIQYLASISDLVRVDGVGPNMAKLFYNCNIKSVLTLSKIDIPKIVKKLQEINKKTKNVPFTPNQEQLDSWKRKAEKLKIILK